MLINNELIYNELQEHTSDSDWARAQHFYEYTRFSRIAKFGQIIQVILLLSLITIYMIFFSIDDPKHILQITAIIATILATITEIITYIYDFNGLANNHWKSAQIYAEIYRKCQFFCANYCNSTDDVWREKLSDISEELSRISILSPSLSSKSYVKVKNELMNKKYPVHKMMENLKTNELDEVLDKIKSLFHNVDIEIYIFGSYLTSIYYNDIDIAVIVHNEYSSISYRELVSKIENSYSPKGINLDISIITEQDLVSNRFSALVKNIKLGKCIFKSSSITKCLFDYDIELNDYPEMIRYFCSEADTAYADKRSKYFITCAYYMYYHALSSILSVNNIIWYSERSLIDKAHIFSSNNNDVEQLVNHIRYIRKIKEYIFLESNTTSDAELERIYKFYSEAKNNTIIKNFIGAE